MKAKRSQEAQAVRAQTLDDFSRPIKIHICKDGTISYRRDGEPTFNGRALPVFSVNTIEQAEALQVLFGRKQYTEHPQMPGRPWYTWTDFSGEVDDLDKVSAKLREWWREARGDDDINAKHCVADFSLKGCRYQVYLLNAGEFFAGFGGSRTGLVTRKTASLIVRESSTTGTHDTEYDISKRDVWDRIFHAAHAAGYKK